MKDNLLENLLRHVVKDSRAASDKLIKKFGSFSDVADADIYAIADTVGGDMSTALYIKLACALVSRRRCDALKFGKNYKEEEIKEYLTYLFFGLSVETVYILPVRNNKILACEKAGEGTVNTSNVLPRRLLEIVKRHGGDSAIIAHNHPGGYAAASDDDRSATRILREFFNSSGIKLLAHYVVAGCECEKIAVD